MALSDELTRLASRAQQVEASATALRTQQREWLDARADALRTSLDETQRTAGERVTEERNEAASAWDDLRQQATTRFAQIRAKAAEHRSDRDAARAERTAEWAELDAEDAVDFAMYALAEAEYAVIEASIARDAADQVAPGQS